MFKNHIHSISEFDHMHYEILNLFFLNNENNCPFIDLSKYKQCELLMKSLRKTLECLIIEHCHLNERLNHVETELNDLKSFTYDTELKKLSCTVSTPLKNCLSKSFRIKNIRFDSLDDKLLDILLNNDHYDTYLSRETYNSIVEIYRKLAQDLLVEDYHKFVKVMICHQQRNSEQHDGIFNYLHRSKTSILNKQLQTKYYIILFFQIKLKSQDYF